MGTKPQNERQMIKYRNNDFLDVRSKRGEKQPRMVPNPLWCDRCEGRGYLVADAEWEPYAVQCDECKDRRLDKRGD